MATLPKSIWEYFTNVFKWDSPKPSYHLSDSSRDLCREMVLLAFSFTSLVDGSNEGDSAGLGRDKIPFGAFFVPHLGYIYCTTTTCDSIVVYRDGPIGAGNFPFAKTTAATTTIYRRGIDMADIVLKGGDNFYAHVAVHQDASVNLLYLLGELFPSGEAKKSTDYYKLRW